MISKLHESGCSEIGLTQELADGGTVGETGLPWSRDGVFSSLGQLAELL